MTPEEQLIEEIKAEINQLDGASISRVHIAAQHLRDWLEGDDGTKTMAFALVGAEIQITS